MTVTVGVMRNLLALRAYPDADSATSSLASP
jgi:hypothetical protein